MDACDPKLDIENLRQMIKRNTGKDLKLTRKGICQAYTDIQEDNLPLPPLVLSKNRTFMMDGKSPLSQKDYDVLFASDSTASELRRIAKKAGVVTVENLTKSDLVDATKRYLSGHKIREPIVLSRKRRITIRSANANANRVNVNTNVNANRTNVNTNVNTNGNMNRMNGNVNVNRVNGNVNRVNGNVNRMNGNTNRVNTNRVNTNVARKTNNSSRVSFPSAVGMASLTIPTPSFATRAAAPGPGPGPAPAPAAGLRAAPPAAAPRAAEPTTAVSFPTQLKPALNTSKPSFINAAKAKAAKDFIPSKKIIPNQPGYVFTTGKFGLGMYRETGAVQGPQLPNSYVPPTQNINKGISKSKAIEQIKSLGLRREMNVLANLNRKNAKYENVVTRARVQKGNEDELVKFINGLNVSNATKSELKNMIASNSLNSVRRAAEEARNAPKPNNGAVVNNGTKPNNGAVVNNGTKPNNGAVVNNGTKPVRPSRASRSVKATPSVVWSRFAAHACLSSSIAL